MAGISKLREGNIDTRVGECLTEGCGERWYTNSKAGGRGMKSVQHQVYDHLRAKPNHYVVIHTKTYYGKKP